MGTVSVSLPSDGTTADVSDYNSPITTLVNEFNGGIDNDNIASGAAIAGSKVADNSIDLEAKASVDTGWREVSDSWTYASATSITVPSDATLKYSVGDKLRLTQSTVKYFYITAVGATTLTITGGTSYTLVNAAISDISYSKAESPLGHPIWLNYTPPITNITNTNGTLVGRFAMHGRTVKYYFKFTLGSSSAIGTNPSFSLPVPIHANYTQTATTVGVGLLQDTGTNQYPAVNDRTSTADTVRFVTAASPLAAVTATAPFTWTTSDTLWSTGSYEAA